METEIHSNNASPIRQRAALSGLCAAVASVFGKVGLSDVNGPVVSFVVHYMCGTEISSSSDNDGGGDYFFTCNSLVSYGARGVFVIAMLLINAIIMGSFLEVFGSCISRCFSIASYLSFLLSGFLSVT